MILIEPRILMMVLFSYSIKNITIHIGDNYKAEKEKWEQVQKHGDTLIHYRCGDW